MRQLLTVDRTSTCTSAVPIANIIVSDLSDGQVDKSAAALLVTLWELGESAGPLLIAPLSEVFGRAIVYHVCNTLFCITVILSALCQSAPLFIALRAATGLFVAANVLNPAVVGDMFLPDHRGGPMSVIFLAPLLAGAVAPAGAGAITQWIGWRSVMWICAIVAGSCEIAFLTFFRETYSVPILRRREEKRLSGMEFTASELRAKKAADLANLRQSIQRPASVMGSSFVLAALSLFGSVYFAQFYVLSVSFPSILEELYGLTPSQAGMCLMGWSKS
jgi:MFS family permease